MSRLLDALKKKYRTPEEALEALGLPASLLKSAVTGDALPPGLARLKSMARDMKHARDDEPDEHFEREQLAGSGEDDETAHADNFPELAQFLRDRGFSEEEVEECCAIAAEAHRMTMDEPEPFRGRPRPGGTMDPLVEDDEEPTGPREERAYPEHFSAKSHQPHGSATDSHLIFKRNGVMDSRNVALALASRITCDNSVPVQHFGTPVRPDRYAIDDRLAHDTSPRAKRLRKSLARGAAMDAAHSHSSRAQASFFARFPDAARIRFEG